VALLKWSKEDASREESQLFRVERWPHLSRFFVVNPGMRPQTEGMAKKWYAGYLGPTDAIHVPARGMRFNAPAGEGGPLSIFAKFANGQVSRRMVTRWGTSGSASSVSPTLRRHK